MTWDKTKPAGTTKIRLSDEEIRENWNCLEDALARDHRFPNSYGSTAGEHTTIQFYNLGGDQDGTWGSPGLNSLFLGGFRSDSTSDQELFVKDSDDNQYQITQDGGLGCEDTNLKALELETDTISEITAAAGVTIDGLLIKDGLVAGTSCVWTNAIGDYQVTAVKLHANAVYPTGTIMLFGNATAPAGWTKKTDWTDNAMLCYSTGAVATGGSDNPQSWTTAVATVAAADHTHVVDGDHTHIQTLHLHGTSGHILTENEMPAHTHDPSPGAANFMTTSDIGGNVGSGGDAYGTMSDTDTTGGGGSHTHGDTDLSDPEATGSSGIGEATANGEHVHTMTQDTFSPKYQEVIAATKD